MTRRSYKRIKTTPMAPAGCHTYQHASRESYYNSMNISYITYRSFIIHHNFGHITSQNTCCKNKLDVL